MYYSNHERQQLGIQNRLTLKTSQILCRPMAQAAPQLVAGPQAPTQVLVYIPEHPPQASVPRFQPTVDGQPEPNVDGQGLYHPVPSPQAPAGPVSQQQAQARCRQAWDQLIADYRAKGLSPTDASMKANRDFPGLRERAFNLGA